MALFDNPEQELRRLQAQLLEEEEDTQAWDDIPEEPFPDPPEEAWDEQPSYEGGFTRSMSQVLMEEEADSHRTVYYEEKRRRKPWGCLLLLLVLAFLAGGWIAWLR